MKKMYTLAVALAFGAGLFAQQKQATFQKAPAARNAAPFAKNQGIIKGSSVNQLAGALFSEDFEFSVFVFVWLAVLEDYHRANCVFALNV